MSWKTKCRGNVVMESCFSRLKVELIYVESCKVVDEARVGIFEYIKLIYNRSRQHPVIACVNRHNYEQQFEQLTVSTILG